MANPHATGKTAGHGKELVQRTRAAVLHAFDAVERDGKLISEILAQEFEKNPIKFMELASKLMPKEIHGEFNHIVDAKGLSDDELADIATGSRNRASSEAQSKTNIH